MRAQRAVVAGDDDAAAPGRVLGVDEILGREAGVRAGFAQRAGGRVGADAADLEDGGGGEEVLRAAGGVLRGAAGDEFGGFGGEFVVEGHVLFFGEDGVVGF